MRLQVAFDLLSLEEVLALLEEVHDLVDIVEIGTPLILKEGIQAVSKVKECYPDQVVLADLKIMDAGALEAEIGFDAGADGHGLDLRLLHHHRSAQSRGRGLLRQGHGHGVRRHPRPDLPR